jgi:hypothetical protein
MEMADNKMALLALGPVGTKCSRRSNHRRRAQLS